ncbi:MAG: glycosyltransferase family 4 protein, partial [Armatimonadetes bacterium]|nr:glycosyltransferase family 4 protein [Armatimonadota bacterium]
GDQSTELNVYAAAHPAALKLLGHRPNDELPPLYGAADLFLMPSRAEAFPRVVLEAMACGAPVVSTDVGTVARIIPPSWHAETLVPAEDLTAFCARTVALVGETDTRARLAAELRQRALDYDVHRVAEQYRDLLTRPL